ncbi:hypothetical protein [Aquabacterium sp.]|uniref:hypothetical protein n=1 Tax=Aquabacterium sp. TaxID=1872578 RepID=UPI0019C3600C|nr:hypothetical protein [Aquabacterium sp.]MBC7700058.1 hypothetical protein [Aquabacterium sp.]
MVALLKVLGKGSGLDSLHPDMSVRFSRKARAPRKARHKPPDTAPAKHQSPA